MSDNCKGAYSIETLVTKGIKGIKLNIPIYQRLFVWEEEQINLLLNDLYNSSPSNKDKVPYYIGIITVVENNGKWDIVDGQQRLTFLSLFGAFCLSSETQNKQQWQNFLFITDEKNELRIHYMGRPEDREDLKKIAGGKTAEIQNSNFRTFLECVEKFKDEKFKERKEDWDNFAGYVYENASFLVSELPAKYTPTDLNLFFEKMNSTGRQLTPVEQIKGKYFPALAAPFDDCLNFEKPFAKENSNTEESGQASSCLLDILKDNDTPVTTESNNQKSDETAGVKSILSPEVFLLHCLGIAKKSQDKELQSSTIVIPHDERKILDTFNKYVGENKEIKPNVLLEIMQEYRKWLV